MTENAKAHERLAKALMQYETLTGKECTDIVLHNKQPKRAIVNTKGGARGNTDMLKPKEEREEKKRSLFGRLTKRLTNAAEVKEE